MDAKTEAHVDKTRKQRSRFELCAMIAIIGVLALALALCFLALYPTKWAADLGDRIVKMKDSIVFFVGLISANLGISFTKGNRDLKVIAGGDGDGS